MQAPVTLMFTTLGTANVVMASVCDYHKAWVMYWQDIQALGDFHVMITPDIPW